MMVKSILENGTTTPERATESSPTTVERIIKVIGWTMSNMDSEFTLAKMAHTTRGIGTTVVSMGLGHMFLLKGGRTLGTGLTVRFQGSAVILVATGLSMKGRF